VIFYKAFTGSRNLGQTVIIAASFRMVDHGQIYAAILKLSNVMECGNNTAAMKQGMQGRRTSHDMYHHYLATIEKLMQPLPHRICAPCCNWEVFPQQHE
jgi:hypothetical protein